MYIRSPGNQSGALLIEVLITIVIIVIGLLGLMQMQTRLQKSEVESYQRTQALMLVKDMASRISTNRAKATDYKTGSSLDMATSVDGSACPSEVGTLQQRDTREWCLALQGAAEAQSGSSVGSLIGGRGCVYELDGGQEYVVAVAWQGLAPISPAPAIACGKGSYDGGTDCVDDECRRIVTTIVRKGSLPP